MNTPTSPGALALARIVQYFETLTTQSVADLSQIYDPHARFKDPFNEVSGVAAITHIFEHMFVTLDRPRFVITQHMRQSEQCFLTWEFRFYFKGYKQGTEQVILGATHLVLSDTGLITLHRDYWDAAEELYEKLPLLGGLMRWVKRRVNA